jgi:hypothetical protein
MISDMWKNLSTEDISEENEVHDDRAERYMAFVDYLGTEDLYNDITRNADLLVERRNELEHAIQILFQPYIAAHQIEIGVFSDTVLIAGKSLAQVIECSSLLMRFVLRKSLVRAERTDFRLLRGGFAKGVELRTSYLKSSQQVHVIPFFDGSLSFVYHLEGVRKGSRLFFSDAVTNEEFGELKNFVFQWTSLSGFGNPTKGVHEFLWPGYLYRDNSLELAELTNQAFGIWRRWTAEMNLTSEKYRSSLYHLDETIKCMVRSFIPLISSSTDDAIKLCVETILPREGDLKRDCDIRFIWGFWFQVLLVLSTANLTAEYAAAIALTKNELSRRKYLDRFIAEAEYPEYAPLTKLFRSAVWN